MNDPYELWISTVAESENTRDSHLGVLKLFEVWGRENYGLEAREIPATWRKAKYSSVADRERFLDELKDVVKDYFAYVKGQYAPLTVNTKLAVVVSYLHAFEIPIKAPRLKYAYVKYHNRDIKKEEIKRILNHSGVRNRAIYLILYESGMRPNTLVNLRYRHVKDEFLGHKIPMKIHLTSDILKCRVTERWTFIGQDGFDALKRYLSTRLPLKEEDYLFVGEKPEGAELRSSALSEAFSKVVKKLKLAEERNGKPKDLRLYCLKKAFKKLHSGPEDYKKFWMGRTETSTHYVSTDVEYHRRLYAEGYENLRLYKPSIDLKTMAKLTRQNMDLKQRVEHLESVLGEIVDLKAQIKREGL